MVVGRGPRLRIYDESAEEIKATKDRGGEIQALMSKSKIDEIEKENVKLRENMEKMIDERMVDRIVTMGVDTKLQKAAIGYLPKAP